VIETTLGLVGRLVLWPFATDRVDRWRWDLTRLCRATFWLSVASILAALVYLPLVWAALVSFVVCAVSFGAAGVCLLELERREAPVSGRSR
jgi:hypothetical protein